MTRFLYASRLVSLPIAIFGLAATAGFAQTGTSTAPAASTSPPAFSSVFDDYKPYSEEKTANWRQSNDTTARVGGWRAYAKEAAEPAPAMVPTPATPAAKP